jgi:septal ring factor EnvC (AmiA/AmiB activator)
MRPPPPRCFGPTRLRCFAASPCTRLRNVSRAYKKLEKEVGELKKKEKAMKDQIKKLKAEVIEDEKDDTALQAKVVKLQKALHAEEEKDKSSRPR